MQYLRKASYDEFIEWYLRRHWRKNPIYPAAATPVERETQMQTWHSGKLRAWFPEADWQLVLLDSIGELERLIFLEDDETRSEGLVIRDGTANYRLLRRVACNAQSIDYLGKATQRPIGSYAAALTSHFRLEGASRLILCTPEVWESEQNPDCSYYLHDGSARALAYMILLLQQTLQFEPVEALLGCKVSCPEPAAP